MQQTPGDFAWVICPSCGLQFLSPRPAVESIGLYYPAGYAPFAARPLDRPTWLQRLSLQYGMRRRTRVVTRCRPTGRLLDVGCAGGRFLAEMATVPGWQVTGIEPNAGSAEQARRAFGLEVISGDLTSAHLPAGSFDVITMWDVIEHLSRPIETLIEARRILASNGCLVLRTPSLDSWDGRLFGTYWAGLDAPRHLAVYRRATIGKLLEQAGFRVDTVRPGGASYFIVMLSLRFWLEEKIPGRRLRQGLLRLCANPLSRLVLALPLAVAERLGLGSEMLVVATPSR